mgnify:CR=1 FL=1
MASHVVDGDSLSMLLSVRVLEHPSIIISSRQGITII